MFILSILVINMKEIGKMAKNMDTVLIPTKMGLYFKVHIKMIKDMALAEFTTKIMSKSKNLNG